MIDSRVVWQTLLLTGLLCIFVLNADAQNKKYFSKIHTDAKNVYDICFTKNGHAIGVADNKSIKVYSIQTNGLIRDFNGGHSGQILSIDIARDSSVMVSGGVDSTVVIWDFKEGHILKSLKCNGFVTSVSLSPDARYLAYGGSDNNVTVYDIENDNTTVTYSHHSNVITAVIFSNDGRYIASAGGDKLIHIYENEALIASLTGHNNWVRDIAFNLDNTRLISCGDDGRVILWSISNINNPRIINDLKHGISWLLTVDFNQDGYTYALGNFRGIVEIRGTHVLYKRNMRTPINKVLFKPNIDYFLQVAIATRGKGVMLIDAKQMKSRHLNNKNYR